VHGEKHAGLERRHLAPIEFATVIKRFEDASANARLDGDGDSAFAFGGARACAFSRATMRRSHR
jgi:hypothetical protein